MRTVRWAVWVAGSVLGVVACGSDGTSGAGTKCGAGTVLSGDECLPQCGPGTTLDGAQCVPATGSGGAASAGASGAGAGRANGGSGASEAGAAADEGGEAGQAPNETSGAGGSAASSNGGTGGHGGIANGGAGTSGGSSAAGSAGTGGGESSAAHWVAFNHNDGVFVYDSTQFPSSSGLVKLSAGAAGSGFAVGPFSPDGRWLAYVDGGDLFVRDFSAGVPGPPVLLLDEAVAFDVTSAGGQHCYWSFDSKTLAFTSANALYILPVTQSVPIVQRRSYSGTVPSLAWSPTQSKLAVAAPSNVQLVETNAGAIVKETLIADAALKSWSPDGSSFVGVRGANVVLTEVNGTAPVVHTLTSPTATSPSPSVIGLAYDPSGKTLAYYGVQERNQDPAIPNPPGANYTAPDLYTVALKPAVATPVRLSSSLDKYTGVTAFAFSPTGDRLAYLVQSVGYAYNPPNPPQPLFSAATHWVVLGLNNGQPGTSVALPELSLSSQFGNLYQSVPASYGIWRPDGAVFIGGLASKPLLYDPTGATAPVAADYSFFSPLVFNGTSNVMAYETGASIGVIDSGNPHSGVTSIQAIIGPWSWSPDGKFIAASRRSFQNQPSLTRVTGASVSTPVGIYPTTSSTVVSLFWRP